MPRRHPSRPPTVASIQKEAVARLKATLFGSDPIARRRYIRDFHQEFHSYRRRVGWPELARAALGADVVLVGDYHALSSCQLLAARILEVMAGGGRPVVLAMEMVFGRHQAFLDRYQAGAIGEAEFLRRIRYEQEWGYPWEGYRRLLETARQREVQVLGADAEPRGGLATIRRRDAHAAARIGSLFRGGARPRVLVLFGESHLARGHLPAHLRRALRAAGARDRLVVIVQNVDGIYWQLAEKGLEQTDAVLVSPRTYCVFNASPLAKYEAYRQTLDRWRGEVYDDGRPDLSPTLHYMIDTILEFLGVDPYRFRVRSAGAADTLVDLYPDVFPVEDDAELVQVLRTEGVSPAEAEREACLMGGKGSRYVPAINAVFIRSFDLLAGAEEATRFIRLALSGSFGRAAPAGVSSGEEARAAQLVEEALGFLGSKVVDPSRRPLPAAEGAWLPSASGRGGEPRGPGVDVMAWGQDLGQRLYDAYHRGVVGRREILGLFRRDLRHPGVAGRTMEWLANLLRGALAGGRAMGSPGRPKRK